ncbi:hypothetical protein BDAP_002197 [Binucleata daphniae]
MSLKCLICNTPYVLQDGVYICEEGHIFHHTQEVCDDYTGFTGKAKKKEKQKDEKVPDFNHSLLLLFSKLYFEMKTILNIKHDMAFKVFLSCFTKDKNMQYNFTFLFAILYHQKRAELENENKILLFDDFVKDFDFCFYQHKYTIFLEELKIRKHKKRRGVTMSSNEVTPHLVEYYIKFIGEETYKAKKPFYSTKIERPKNDLKKVFRLNIRRDNEMMSMYLEKILGVLHIKNNELLQKSFIRLCNFYCRDDRLFVPERFIYFFLFIYIKKHNVELDLYKIEVESCFVEDSNSVFADEMQRYKEILQNERKYIEKMKKRREKRIELEVIREKRDYEAYMHAIKNERDNKIKSNSDEESENEGFEDTYVKEIIPFMKYSDKNLRMQKVFAFLLNTTSSEFFCSVTNFLSYLDCLEKQEYFELYDTYETKLRVQMLNRLIINAEIKDFEKRERRERKRLQKILAREATLQ